MTGGNQLDIQTRGLGLTYAGGIEALCGVDLAIRRGEIVSIVGPSGCGKSTLLKAVAGLVPATDGELRVLGQELDGRSRVGGHVAFVFQAPTLLSWRTVLGNVELPVELRHAGRIERRNRARELLELVGLSDFARRYPPELSGGMQMRVSLARALITQPEIMLLDEPFGALDDITRQRLNEDLLAIWMAEHWTGLFVTHNVAEAVFLGERVLVMSDRPGRMIAEVAVDLPLPRPPDVRTGPAFARLVGTVGASLREGP